MKIYIGAKASRQISEDGWEIYYPMKDFSELSTLKEVADWLQKFHQGADISFTGYIETQVTESKTSTP